MTRQNIAASLEKMKIPALIIGGQRDNVIPNHLQRTLAGLLPQSETYFLVDGSHVPQADFPELINERIDLYLNQKIIRT
jgi:pimeloyl-ACP methyl ester carboxylesterase